MQEHSRYIQHKKTYISALCTEYSADKVLQAHINLWKGNKGGTGFRNKSRGYYMFCKRDL